MTALLFHLDGKMPNLALMRLSAHLKEQGAEVVFRRTGQPERTLWELDQAPDQVYASTIFQATKPAVLRLQRAYPGAIIGGTGYDIAKTLESVGVSTRALDYSLYPDFRPSIGFTQRGCRLRCSFCVVPAKEGRVREEQTIAEIWRGEPYPREVVLLDNDFFGQAHWRDRIRELQEGKFKVSFNQGINARCLTEEAAEAIASVLYYDDGFTTRRIYTAWDNLKDEQRLFEGLGRLVKYGVKPDHIMVYMLIGYWPGESEEDRLHRQRKLREFGCRPYPMPFVRTPELVGFQRWVVAAYDKRIPWQEWRRARYQPCNLGFENTAQMDLVQIEGAA